MEVQPRRVLEDHALGKLVLKLRTALGELVDGVELFALGAHDADVDVAMLEVRRQVHGLHGDELGVERHLAHESVPSSRWMSSRTRAGRFFISVL